MKNIFLISIIVVLANSLLFSQNYFVRGKAKEKESGLLLGFTNIRVANSTTGTSANKNGEYEIRLPAGSYKLIASFIGYKSDTVLINLNRDLNEVDFNLKQTNVDLPEVIVLPGENPALEIIRKAVERKKEREEEIKNYEFKAYTKAVILTPNEINAGTNEIDITVGKEDTLKITGIIENESKGYFQKPGNYKEIITARKQTANFPSEINILTGGRIMQNFYNDEISFLGEFLPGPLDDNSLSYYYFYIEETMAIDDKTVFRIRMIPDDKSDPGFEGNIYILDKTYDLIKVELNLNKAANPGGIFDTVHIFQQFSSYGNSIYMPVDYRLYATANYLNIAKFGFELNTILYNYKINTEIDEDIFSKAIVTVEPDADNKDSLYWISTQTIPNTEEETRSYNRIDSLKNVPRTFWDKFSFLSDKIRISKNLESSAPLGMYHFNRVEGHTLDYGLFLNNVFDKRLDASLRFAYGFSDEKFKTDFYGSYLLGNYRTYKIKLNAFNRLNVLFSKPGNNQNLLSTLVALISKYEFNDYYYSRGFDVEISGDVFPVVNLKVGFINRTDKNAYNNSDFSFFDKDKTYRLNPAIFETKINALKVGFKLDFRNYIEDGYSRRRISFGGSYITFEGDITWSNKDILHSNLDFTKYELRTNAVLRTFRNCTLEVETNLVYSDGPLPFQMMHNVSGNIDIVSVSHTFRTLKYNKVLGDRIGAVMIEHFWGNELFRWIGVPGLKDWDIMLNSFFNAAYTNISDKSRSILNNPLKVFKNPFYEAGFGIGHALLPFSLEFAWKLNHKDGDNFRVSINSFIPID
jgi:hypothetical protein